jgi:predicted nucleotidyltransferase
MNLYQALDEVFATRSQLRVLRALVGLPQGFPASTRELARRAGISHPTASAVLNSLADQGIASKRVRSRLTLFQLNQGHVLVPRLRSLFEWERDLPTSFVEFLRKQLGKHQRYVLAAVLFGSAARNDMEATSDVDLAVLVREGQEVHALVVLEELEATFRTRFGNRLAPLVSSARSPEEWPDRPKIWRRVAEEGIPVIGRPPAVSHGKTRQER